jgi:hypothetical protein
MLSNNTSHWIEGSVGGVYFAFFFPIRKKLFVNFVHVNRNKLDDEKFPVTNP